MHSSQRSPAPLGSVEPHAPLLRIPSEGQLLYKILTVENLLHSITDNYLHFNRVDHYRDFPNADKDDGKQLPEDEPTNTASRFQGAPTFTAADYYNQSRSRTYACCFSIKNSQYIWENYGSGSTNGKVCLIFDFGKLRNILNRSFESDGAAVIFRGVRCHQIFSLNYGLTEYVNWQTHRANVSRLPNPILYTYIKGKKFCPETELRISLSAIGIGQFVLKDGAAIDFPPSLRLQFNYKQAIVENALKAIECSPETDRKLLGEKLKELPIIPIRRRASQ